MRIAEDDIVTLMRVADVPLVQARKRCRIQYRKDCSTSP
jgi:hypothetical protein